MHLSYSSPSTSQKTNGNESLLSFHHMITAIIAGRRCRLPVVVMMTSSVRRAAKSKKIEVGALRGPHEGKTTKTVRFLGICIICTVRLKMLLNYCLMDPMALWRLCGRGLPDISSPPPWNVMEESRMLPHSVDFP
jgi:hypothetical protein